MTPCYLGIMRLPLLLSLSLIMIGTVTAHADTNSVSVRLIGPEGKPGPVTVLPRVVKSDAQWEKQLGPVAYRILRAKGTEAPFCGNLLDNHKEGVYFCAGCGLPLFSSGSKFHSGTGWPSFYEPFAKENITELRDASHGMIRTEILCTLCGGHLGHVFDDGPAPTGLRYCLNSAALVFRDEAEVKKMGSEKQGLLPVAP
jgi:methionine-R-sulfoxide reductase